MININTKENKDIQPQIYIACLSSYNSGILHGKWIVPSTDEGELQDQINSILKTSKQPFAEEWAVHDYNYFHNLGEYPSLEDICKVQEAINEHGYELVNAYLQFNDDVDSLDDLEYSYAGHYDSFQDYAQQYLEEADQFNMIPDHLQYYFDYELYAKNLEHDYYTIESSNNGVYIFRNF